MIVAQEQGDIKIKKAQWIVPSAHAGGIFIGADMQLKILSEKFYANYAHCSEILKKRESALCMPYHRA